MAPIGAKDIHTGDRERKGEHKKELERGEGRSKEQTDSRGDDRDPEVLEAP